MAAKIISFLITFGINLATAFALLFFMLLAMNGFSESDAVWGIYAFIALGFLIAAISAFLCVFLLNYLKNKRNFSALAAAAISVVIFIAAGAVLNFAAFFFGIIIADIKRTHF